ncbi:MAG: PAS domain S-box protein, partial [Dehalococcoidia bacterium]|nr:PAS domain S-box protein [Dehalococcoidia bacterium]
MRQKAAGKDKNRTVKKASKKPVTVKPEAGKAKALREKVVAAVSSEPGALPFENLLQETSAGVCIFDRDNIAVRCNDQLSSITGLSGEQIQGKKLRKNMLAGRRGDIDHIQQLFEQAKKSLQIVRINGLAVTLNSGSSRVWNLKALPQLDRKGNYAGMELVIDDCTDDGNRQESKLPKRKRKQHEQAGTTVERLKKEISELKKSLEELRKNEEKYRSMLDEMDEAYYELDSNGNYTFVNETIARQLGYTTEEVKKLNYKDYVPREHWRQTVEAYMDVYKTGVPRRWHPQVNVRKDGKWIYLEDSILHVKNEKGETIGLRGISRDVTERRKAEEEIKKRALLLDSAYDSIIAFDLDGNVIYANESAWRTRGFTHDEIQSMNMRQLVPAEKVELIDQRLKRIVETGELTFEAIHITRNGTSFPVDARARVVDLEGQKIIVAVYRDATQRIQMETALIESEGKYRSLVESAGAGVASVNLSGDLTFVNDTICRLTGYTKNELMGRPFADFLHPDDRDVLLDYFLDGVKGARLNPHLEFRLVHKTGNAIWFSTNPTELKDEGRIVGFDAILHEITERKRLEAELRQSEERYRTIVEDMQESYHELDLKGNCIFATDSLARILGYNGDELIGLNFSEVVSEEEARELYRQFNEIYRTGQQNRNIANRFYRKDGSIRYMENIVSLMKNEGGEPIGFRVVSRDVTERKKLEEALRQSEERYRTILEHLQEVYDEVDLKGNYTFVNEAIFPLLGYTREEFVGLNYRAVTFTDDIEPVKRAFNEVYRTGIPNEAFTYRVIHKDGRILFVETSIALIKDDKGEPVGFSVVARNATERNKLEEALKHSEERYRTILEEIQDGYLEVDLTGNITFSNDQAARFLGFTGAEFIGVNFRAYTDPDYIQTVFKVFNDVYSTGVPNNGFVFKIRFKDGSSGFVETSVSLLKNQQGEVIGFRCVGRDTTARERLEEALRKSEEKYRTILEQIEDAYFEMDLEGKYTFVNDTFCRNMRYTRGEIIGMTAGNVVHPDDYKDMFKAYLEVYRTGVPNKGVAFRVYAKDGEMGYSENTITPIRNDKGDIVGFRSIARNITERKQLEDALRQSEERYSSIMEEMEDLYAENDLKGYLIYLNDAFCRKLGYKREELIGKSYREMESFDPETKASLVEAFNEVFRTGQPREGLTVKFNRKDGSQMLYGGRTYIGL